MRFELRNLIPFTSALFVTYIMVVPQAHSAEENQYILSSTIKGITITINEIYAWRNWQPIVSRAGKDNGSPLMVKTLLSIKSDRKDAIKIHWEAYLEKINDGEIFPIEIWDSDSDSPWSGEINSHEIKKVVLRTYSGPYLEPETSINLIINFNINGEYLRIKSKPVQIEAVH